MNQNMGTCLVVITTHEIVKTAKLKNLRNTEICQSPSVDSHFDRSVRQMGLNGSQIFCFFLFVSALNAVRCTTRPQTAQRSANGWPNAQMIQRRPTTSAHTLKMYERHTSNLLPQCSHCNFCPELSVDVESKPGSRIGPIHTIGSCSNLVWIEVSISAMVVVSSHFWARQQRLCRSVMAVQEFKAWNMTRLCRLGSCSQCVTCVTSSLQNSDVDAPLPKVWT